MSDYKKVITQNKKAIFEYSIEQRFQAGIVLLGSEVKSVRAGNVSIIDSYAALNDNKLFLYNCYIAEYGQAGKFNHPTKRAKALLLKKKEIQKIVGKLKLRGYALIAISAYFSEKNIIKIELGLSKGKKQHDKREAIKNKDWKIEQARILRNKRI